MDQSKTAEPVCNTIDNDSIDQDEKPTKRSTEFTTENFKIEVSNLPNKLKFHIVKNLLERQFKLNPHKIRLGQAKVYVSFCSEQDRDDAIDKLNQQEWKGRTIRAQLASPRDDLVAKKRKVDDTCTEINDTPITNETINDQVCPLWNTEYDEQIDIKEQFIRSVLNFSRKVIKLSPSLESDDPRLYQWARKNPDICCPFDGVLKSPALRGYRNKCEFNIGHDGQVGFKIGRYKSGSDRICHPPDDCPIMTDNMHRIVDHFQRYLLEETSLKGYDLLTHEGNYRQLTIRRNQLEQYLIIVDMHPQELSKEEIDSEKKKVVNYMTTIGNLVSIYFNISEKCSFSSSNQSLSFVYGEAHLVEQLHVDPDKPLKFRVGPASFFQVNTKAAELLYRTIIDVANLGSSSFVLDVGCGTGTIGLSLAQHVKYVIGIDIVPQAIEDAKINAAENGIENVSFYAGKAEDLISESLRIMRNKIEYDKIDNAEIVAIVDPPRVGFNSSFIKTIRGSQVKKLIYVACDPKANTNLITLCRPKSKAYQGDPFVPVRAKAFDLFPYTKLCELVLVYERLSMIALE